MSGARSAIDVMTAEDTALLDSMRNETEAPEVEVVDLPEPDLDDAPEAEPDDAPAAAPEPGAEAKPLSRTAKRIQELTVARDTARAEAAAEKQARAVSEGVVAERLRLLTEAANAAMQPTPTAPVAPPPIEIPDINTDPVGHFKAKLEIAERRDAERDAILQGFTQQQQQNQQAQEMWDWGRASEAEFSAKEPSYLDATQFMLERRKAQLAAIGIVNPSEQQQVIKSDIMQIAMKSRAENANFGERMYKVAEAFGYQKKAPEPAVATAPVIPPLDAGLPVTDRVARVEAGRANSTTIATVGASTPISLTPERIANMSDAQFAKHVEALRAGNPAGLRDLMGH